MPPTGTPGLPLNTGGNVASISANPEEERIWTRILSEVTSKCPNNTPQGTVLVLGDSQCGKSWLLSRLEKKDVSGRGSALEYHFLNVHSDYRDASYAYQLSTAGAGVAPGESVTLPVWVLDGDEVFAPLVKFALTSSLSRSVVILCASLSHPGTIMASLNKWSKMIDAQIQQIYDRQTVADARKAQELFWQEYVEPLDSSMHSDKIPSMETEQVLLPLDQNVLTNNTGAALVVVLTKSDLAHSELSDEQLDRLQYHVRKFCMRHGAALIYTSAKEEKNTALLYKYLIHRVCGAPFTTPAHVVDKDAIFIPAGWDNDKKLDIVRETLNDPEHPLEVPREWQQVKDQLVEAEDEQAFLQKLTNIELASPKRPPMQKPQPEGADGNSPLVSFFNNLLKTKEGQQSAAAVRPVADPQAQLQRMLEHVNTGSSPSATPFTDNSS
ncbi:hypothetical protein AB6A40_000599 [Gnathostoma spinigerum]|uniref:Dynein light intermediate chain n=1 Tax=Gnathostoma spinigerum TaxID=75299 RepID=A0ABD6EC67_9BILA